MAARKRGRMIAEDLDDLDDLERQIKDQLPTINPSGAHQFKDLGKERDCTLSA
jgi:hypothetical protein